MRRASKCLVVVLDFERYPDWARDVKQVTILERDAEGRGDEGRVPRRGARQELPVHAGVRLLGPADGVLVGARRGGRAAPARRFVPVRAGRTTPTRVHYELAVDIAIPLPGLIKRRAAGMIMGTALKELKKAVETAAP